MRCGSYSPILYVVICVLFYNRLGDFFNIKMETHGLRQGLVTLLHVSAMEDSTRQFLLVEVVVINWKLLMTCGCWT